MFREIVDKYYGAHHHTAGRATILQLRIIYGMDLAKKMGGREKLDGALTL